jgi:hypothetical protein
MTVERKAMVDMRVAMREASHGRRWRTMWRARAMVDARWREQPCMDWENRAMEKRATDGGGGGGESVGQSHPQDGGVGRLEGHFDGRQGAALGG